MGNLVKQTVNKVVLMEATSRAHDPQFISIEIDCEGGGRFFRLSTGSKESEIYFGTPDDFRLVYETALAMWRQGDIYVPGETEDDDLTGNATPTLTPMLNASRERDPDQ